MKCTVPSKRRVRASWRAAPISMLVWPSCPQPWCTPGVRLAWAQRPSSTIGSASMSARRPTLRVAAAAAQRADHAGAAQAFMDLEAEQAQRLRHHAGRAPFLERELGMRMQVAAQRDQFGQQVGDRRGDRVQRQCPASTASASSASVWKW